MLADVLNSKKHSHLLCLNRIGDVRAASAGNILDCANFHPWILISQRVLDEALDSVFYRLILLLTQ